MSSMEAPSGKFFPDSFWAELAREVKNYVDKSLATRCAALETKIARLEGALAEKSAVKYMGVHRTGATYSEGSLVTRDGSIFHANKTTSEIPGEGCLDWQLACKRGRDGKDATGK
jgi:hypothetical protein